MTYGKDLLLMGNENENAQVDTASQLRAGIEKCMQYNKLRTDEFEEEIATDLQDLISDNQQNTREIDEQLRKYRKQKKR